MWSFAHFQTPGALMWFCFCSPSPRITVVCLAQWGNLFGWWQETRTYKSVIKMHSGIAGFIYFLNVWIKYLQLCSFFNLRGTWGIFFFSLSPSTEISRKWLLLLLLMPRLLVSHQAVSLRFGQQPLRLLEIFKKINQMSLWQSKNCACIVFTKSCCSTPPPAIKKQGILSV